MSAPPPRRRRRSRWLAAPFVLVAAIILLAEEWLWDDLARLLARVGRLAPFRWIEPAVRRLPPWAAVLLFGAPTVLLIPVKLAALWFVARGQAMLGFLTLIVAKIAGTALLARIYSLTEPQLLRIPWFAWLHARVMAFKTAVHEAIEANVMYRAARERLRRLRAYAAALVGVRHPDEGGAREPGSWRRRWAAVFRLSRRRGRPPGA